ncbi:MAG TPA: pyruvate flavodoxin/ferredoxin oxidoreductase, partial [Ignavibacteria bacterium]|nr:pyruvate flavodoxin/ferredoxin oxidoreductase [Ignavibacteria bacterium]
LRSGNQMVAEGAIKAGCRFFAGYPITPASGVYKGMIDMLPQNGGIAISSPDEISALAYCVGASMRGFKAMTATSGPGWALMIETVQYALITETPVVICVVQRLGPCTGGATQGGQGDILITEFATSGGYTIPVLYPTNAKECYELTVEAFNWAEKLRTPIVLLTDKEVGMTTESVNYSSLFDADIISRPKIKKSDNQYKNWKMYGFDSPDMIAKFTPVGGDIKVTATGSAHNALGKLKKNDVETISILKHLEEKIQHHKHELVITKEDYDPNAETLIISFGITARTMKEAVKLARQTGKKVSSLAVLCMFPVPENKISKLAAHAKRVIIAEENIGGQYRKLIEPILARKEVIGINKIGSMITPREITERIL